MWIKKEIDISNMSDYLYGLASRVWWSANDDQRNSIWELVLDTFDPTEPIDEAKLNDFIAYNCIDLLDEEDDDDSNRDYVKCPWCGNKIYDSDLCYRAVNDICKVPYCSSQCFIEDNGYDEEYEEVEFNID